MYWYKIVDGFLKRSYRIMVEGWRKKKRELKRNTKIRRSEKKKGEKKDKGSKGKPNWQLKGQRASIKNREGGVVRLQFNTLLQQKTYIGRMYIRWAGTYNVMASSSALTPPEGWKTELIHPFKIYLATIACRNTSTVASSWFAMAMSSKDRPSSVNFSGSALWSSRTWTVGAYFICTAW